MFNLDVAELDNYYVGEYGWLVHNQVPDINYHHIFPQEFKNFFDPLGININDYTVGVYNGWEHQRGIHGRGGVIGPQNTFLPGRWNDRWANWIDNNPGATRNQVEQFAKKMLRDYGLDKLPVVPYPCR